MLKAGGELTVPKNLEEIWDIHIWVIRLLT